MSLRPNIKVGDRFLTNNCGWCTVISYHLYSKIEVEFDQPHVGRKFCTGNALKKGTVQNPNEPTKVDELEMCDDWDKLFVYDESSPSCLRWKVSRYSGKGGLKVQVQAGDAAGTKSENDTGSYWNTRAAKRRVQCHRIVWEMHHGKILDRSLMIDHIDGNGLNNKLSNLRLVTRAVNARNVRKHKNSSTKMTGVKLQENTDRRGLPYFYYVAYCRDLEGRERHKCFPVAKYGEQEAFRLACEYRAKMIAELNEQGAGYTERHGT